MEYNIITKIYKNNNMFMLEDIGYTTNTQHVVDLNNSTNYLNYLNFIQTNKNDLENGNMNILSFFENNIIVYNSNTSTNYIPDLQEFVDISNLI